jgi:hypothetical protein
MNCVELVEDNGCVWSLVPIAVDEADDLHVCERWLGSILQYLNPLAEARSVQIVYSDFIMKRGAVNKSFKRRWMVLTSDGKVSHRATAFKEIYSLMNCCSAALLQRYCFEGVQRKRTFAFCSVSKQCSCRGKSWMEGIFHSS